MSSDYAMLSELEARYDSNEIASLSQDDGTETVHAARVGTILSSVSQEVYGLLRRWYTDAQLLDSAVVTEIVCAITWYQLHRRRPPVLNDIEAEHAQARAKLQLIMAGALLLKAEADMVVDPDELENSFADSGLFDGMTHDYEWPDNEE